MVATGANSTVLRIKGKNVRLGKPPPAAQEFKNPEQKMAMAAHVAGVLVCDGGGWCNTCVRVCACV